MSGRLAGKVAFITGAARGQGRAHALRMAQEGADIIAVDIAGKLPSCVPYDPATPDDLSETVRLVEETNRRIIASVVDTRDFAGLGKAVDDGVAALGQLDIIVANAGVAAPQAWNDITPQNFRDVMEINVTGTWNTVMAGADKIIEGRRGGSIILISSAAGMKMQPFMVHYTVSKHAVTGMARAFAAELGKHSIRVNSVHPGPVNTPMGSGDMVAAIGKAMETNPQLANVLTRSCPSGWPNRKRSQTPCAGWPATNRGMSPPHRSPWTRFDAILISRSNSGNRFCGSALAGHMKAFTESERQEFLAAKHVAVLSVDAADGRPPASIPIWYDYTPGGNIRIMTGVASRKARLIERAGKVTLVVQREELPYQYVVVEGSLVETIRPAPADVQEAVAIRYLGEEGGRAFLRSMEGVEEVLYVIRPDRWLSADFTGDL